MKNKSSINLFQWTETKKQTKHGYSQEILHEFFLGLLYKIFWKLFNEFLKKMTRDSFWSLSSKHLLRIFPVFSSWICPAVCSKDFYIGSSVNCPRILQKRSILSHHKCYSNYFNNYSNKSFFFLNSFNKPAGYYPGVS